MVLTTMAFTTVEPRGGPAATPVTITGSGFGGPAGTVTFDPIGTPVPAAVAAWADGAIDFTVPVGLPVDRFLMVLVRRQDGSDAVTFPFWIPTGLAPSIGYQWPDFEEGTADESADNPRKVQAADFNRVVDSVAISPGGLAAHVAAPDPHPQYALDTEPAIVDYAGRFEGPAIGTGDIGLNRWGWWYDTFNSRLLQVRNRSGILYGVELFPL